MKPIGVQLQRKKGWRKPPNTIVVARPSIFGNPFTVKQLRELGSAAPDIDCARYCVEAFRTWLGPKWETVWCGRESAARRAKLLEAIPKLRGKNLACWCKIGMPCHRDVLLELANKGA